MLKQDNYSFSFHSLSQEPGNSGLQPPPQGQSPKGQGIDWPSTSHLVLPWILSRYWLASGVGEGMWVRICPEQSCQHDEGGGAPVLMIAAW